MNIPMETISSKILIIRDSKAMLDRHLANMYGMETRALKQAVYRNHRGVDVNIAIMSFVQTRKMLASHDQLKKKRRSGKKFDEQFCLVFETNTQLLEEEEKTKRSLGSEV